LTNRLCSLAVKHLNKPFDAGGAIRSSAQTDLALAPIEKKSTYENNKSISTDKLKKRVPDGLKEHLPCKY
jgi:hypothetical protein